MKRRSLLANGISLSLGLLLVVSIGCLSAFGQAGTSTIRGIVRDPQGNVVSGATVTLTNVGTTTSRTTTTSDLGAYAFEFVPVGDYKVEVEAKGFKKAVVTDVHALVSKVTPADVTLEIGAVSETVTVAAGAAEALINKDDATLGNTFTNKQVTQLPASGRNIVPFLTLQPAVTRDGQVSGARNDQNNFTLDGVDANESQTNTVGLAGDDPTTSQQPTNNVALRLNAEAIQEFRVTTSNPNASQGRSAGGQISLITKAGSNEWHGSGFEFYRSKGMTANDFFNNRVGQERPQLVRHTFGGSVGGPVIKDRAFFFYSFERQTRITQTSVLRTVPLASMGRGELRFLGCPPGTSSSACGTTVTPSIITLTTAQLNTIFPNIPGGMNPLAAAALGQAAAKYSANDFGLTGDGLNTAGFRFNAATPVTLNSHVGRFDFNLSSKQQLFVRTNVIYDLTSLAPQFPDTPSPKIWSHPWGAAIGHTWTISNNLVNRFVYGYTREAFTQQGDSADNSVNFRFIFQPFAYSRTLSRKTPVQNFVDDVSWIRGNHNWQFGTNIRVIRNQRTSFANAFDALVTNPSGYSGGAGASLSTPVNNFAPIKSPNSIVQNAVTALIGRFSQYTANFTFNNDGTILAAGSPTDRNFATEEYEWYAQDVWKFRSNITVTAGLRYSLSRPVYETKGFEMKSNIPLSDLFAQRLAGAAAGTPVNTLITFDKSGPANGRAPLYNWDKNNFQPRVAVAWQPRFRSGLLGRVFGDEKSSIRGGFAISNDQYGEQLAVSFDLNNVVGFASSQVIPVNTFCTDNAACVAPLFTGYGQAVRTLPKIIVPTKLNLPNLQPADNSRRIESSLDSNLVAPINYSWNFTFERQLPKGIVVQASYLGRYAKNLIAQRDVMALNDLVDPKSGMDWYTAATQLEILRTQGVPVSAVAQIPYFANLFPANLAALINTNYFGRNRVATTINGVPTTQTQAVYLMGSAALFGNDWTDTQDALDTAIGGNLFFHPQYGALATYSSIGHSWYDAGTLSIRERLGRSLTMDFNYTLSHSLDDASGAQTSGAYNYALFIENPIRQQDWYANSDFDIRHIINANAVWELPFGRGRTFFGKSGKALDAALGGWQVSGIFRWNSGLPASAPIDDARWATNWNAQSYTVRVAPFQACPDRGGLTAPKLFGCDPTGSYRSFRNARPGESGDRNVFRLPGYVALDIGLAKTFTMPWSEKQKLQLRVEAINVTNTQRMGTLLGGRAGYGIALDPAGAPFGCTPGTGGNCVENPKTPDPTFSNFSAIQGTPRQVQIGIHFQF